MKKRLALLFACLFLLTACHPNDMPDEEKDTTDGSTVTDETAGRTEKTEIPTQKTCFYNVVDGVLYQYRILSGYAMPVCPDPLCDHQSAACPFYGVGNTVLREGDDILFNIGKDIFSYNENTGKKTLLTSGNALVWSFQIEEDRLFFNTFAMMTDPKAEHNAEIQLYEYNRTTKETRKLNREKLYDIQDFDSMHDGRLYWCDRGTGESYSTDMQYENRQQEDGIRHGIVVGDRKYRIVPEKGGNPPILHLAQVEKNGNVHIVIPNISASGVKTHRDKIYIAKNRETPKIVGQAKTESGRIQDVKEYVDTAIYQYDADGQQKKLLCRLPDGVYIHSLSSMNDTNAYGDYIGVYLKEYTKDENGYITGSEMSVNMAIINTETGECRITVSPYDE